MGGRTGNNLQQAQPATYSRAGDPAHFLAGLFAKLTFLKFIFFQGVVAFPWGTFLMETDRA